MEVGDASLAHHHLRPLLLPTSKHQHSIPPSFAFLRDRDRQRQRRPSFGTTSSTLVSPVKSTFDDSTSVSTPATFSSPSSSIGDNSEGLPRAKVSDDVEQKMRRLQGSTDPHMTGVASGFPNPPPRPRSKMMQENEEPIRTTTSANGSCGFTGAPLPEHLIDVGNRLDPHHTGRDSDARLRVQGYRRRLARSPSRETNSPLAGEAAWDDKSTVDATEWNRNSMLTHESSTDSDDAAEEDDYRVSRSSRRAQESTPRMQEQLKQAPSAWSLHAAKVYKPSRQPLLPPNNGPSKAERPRTSINNSNSGSDVSTPQLASDEFEVAALRRQVEQLQMALSQKVAMTEERSRSLLLSLEDSEEREQERPSSCIHPNSNGVPPHHDEGDWRMPALKPRPSDPLPPTPVGHMAHYLGGREKGPQPTPVHSFADLHNQLPSLPPQPRQYRDYYDSHHAVPRAHPSVRHERMQHPYDGPHLPPSQQHQHHAAPLFAPRDYAYAEPCLQRITSMQLRNAGGYGGDAMYDYSGYRSGAPSAGGSMAGVSLPPSYISAPPSTAWPDESVSQAGSEEARKIDELARKVEALEALLRRSGAAGAGAQEAAPAASRGDVQHSNASSWQPQPQLQGGGGGGGGSDARSSNSNQPTTRGRASNEAWLHTQSRQSQRWYHQANDSFTSSTSKAVSAFHYNVTGSQSSALPSCNAAAGTGVQGSNVDLTSSTSSQTLSKEARKKRMIPSLWKSNAAVFNAAGRSGDGGGSATQGEEGKTSLVNWGRKGTEKTQVPKVKMKQGPGRGRVYIVPQKE